MKLLGYDFLGNAKNEGMRYAWHLKECKYYVESASFYSHRKNATENIAGYTTSVSSGCILHAMQCPCLFCRTGSILPFGKLLTAKEIALQNITMVLADMYLTQDTRTVTAKREFAYMGQGEPGYSYSQVRMAIAITNKAMEILNQDVYRHIISTSGVPEMIVAYLDDFKAGFYNTRVTLHFSLHLTDRRNQLMPINNIYSYEEVIEILNRVKSITGEKPCVGILLFPYFSTRSSNDIYSSDLKSVLEILHILDPEKVRISFCELNLSKDVGNAQHYPQEKALEILYAAESMGFEAKLFSSFGQEELAACGMLGGKEPNNLIVENHYGKIEKQAKDILNSVMSQIACEL